METELFGHAAGLRAWDSLPKPLSNLSGKDTLYYYMRAARDIIHDVQSTACFLLEPHLL